MSEPNLFEVGYQMQKEEQQETVKINSLELENVKRVKAVKLEPTASGLTVVGGKNNQGKTSVLDAITWALGGEKYKPSQPDREGSMIPPKLHIELSNGIVVERGGKNSALKVTDPSGKKGNQTLLDSFISQFALDLPKFINSSTKDKANTLLQIIGVGDQLDAFDKQESQLYNRRTEIGRIADQKKKYADEMVQWDGVPEEIVSAAELIQQQQEILARNGRNQELRNQVTNLEAQKTLLNQRMEETKKALSAMEEQMTDLINKLVIANTNAKDLQDESTAELEESIANIDSTNAKVRDNLNKQRAQAEAEEYKLQYGDLTTQLEDVRKARMELLNGVEMPLQNLSVDNGELVYKGQRWDNMSGSDQLKVATAIVRKTNPKCGFVLLDKLEQMDVDTMKEFGHWLQENNLQAIATRVSTGDECSIFIEDGYSIDKSGNKTADSEIKPAGAWKAGTF